MLGKNSEESSRFDKQNFFELASIQAASLGLYEVVGKVLAAQYGVGTAVCSIIIGNLILWLIALAVISMVDKIHLNAIDNFKIYFGKYGGVLAALILIVAMLNWYAAQINFSLRALNQLFDFSGTFNKEMMVRTGAAFGLLAAMLSIGGIRLLKKLTVAAIPFLFCFHIYSIAAAKFSVSLKGTWGVSFPAIISSVLVLLPGVINFPTFFRHSRSRAHSVLALTLLTILISFFEITTIWMGFDTKTSFAPIWLIAIFIIVVLIFCNMLNIYLASACWETISNRFGGPKGFAILGLFGTLVYTFVQVSAPVQFLNNVTNAYIAILGIVLILAYLTRLSVQHRPRNLEKSINIAAWLFGCVVATVNEVQHFPAANQSLMLGVNASLLFFLAVIFVEETVWAVALKMGKNLFRKG